MRGKVESKIIWAWGLSFLAHLGIAGLLIADPSPSENLESLQFSVVERPASSPPSLKSPQKASRPEPLSQASPSPSDKRTSPSSAVKSTRSSSVQKGSQKLDLEVDYPPLSLQRREEGRAIYQLRFSAGLKLVAFEQLRSTGFSRLDASVERALARNLVSPSENPEYEEKLIIDFRLRGRRAEIQFD